MTAPRQPRWPGIGAWRRPRVWIRPFASLILLGCLVAWLDIAAIVAEFERLSTAWVALALVLTLPQVAISAWRWKLTARLLNVRLRWGAALGDYYLATFLNQVLPGGVIGDATRAWRHARESGARGPAVRAVIIERISGQMVLAAMALLTLLSPIWREPLTTALSQGSIQGPAAITISAAGAWLIACAALIAVGWLIRRLSLKPPPALRGLGSDVYRSLLSASAWPRQMLGSLLVVASYVAVFVCAARAIGVELPIATLLALIPAILMAMAIPLSIAGWGLREGAAALVWVAAGLSPAQGVAVSMAYGLLVLASSLPGALFLVRRRAANASRHGGGGKGQIEQRVVATGKGSRHGTQRAIEGVDRRQREPRPTGTDQQRRHQQMQAVQHAGFEKPRYRQPAALDQHPPKPARGKHVEHRTRLDDSALAQRQHDTFDMPAHRADSRRARADQVQRRRLAGLKDVPLGRQSATRVEHHAQRIMTIDQPHAEAWIVGIDGARADQHGIDQRPQPMQMPSALDAVHVMRRPGHGRDAPIEALPKLGDRQRLGAGHQRQQAVEQVAHVVVDRSIAMPGAATPNIQTPVAQGQGQRHD
ncbi:Uncharacterized membrane protein YbhN, UPF0104 family [Modicisalibacter muralis]|uniref:Uncharacterized membrane protein YbhN, UPF0104 family n=1 Tax=Modicisalibacter muralis TaxID=119000 RepID=A0A1G9ELZ7_9GAMM|nr:Uncharacterized membrane protein YbhN, UPF0104 family [Halomonas muralis]